MRSRTATPTQEIEMAGIENGALKPPKVEKVEPMEVDVCTFFFQAD